ncbi:MAG: hypothetical protein OCD76_09440 [Reichenbachiella sp.]
MINVTHFAIDDELKGVCKEIIDITAEKNSFKNSLTFGSYSCVYDTFEEKFCCYLNKSEKEFTIRISKNEAAAIVQGSLTGLYCIEYE